MCQMRRCLVCRFNFIDDLCEGSRVIDDEIAEDLTIEFDIRFLQFIDENTVRHIMLFDCFAYSGDPKSSKVPLSEFASMIGIGTGVECCFVGDFNKSTFCTPIPFG